MHDPWQEFEEVQTTAEHLRGVLACWSRLAILAYIADHSGDVSSMAEGLGLKVNHLSNHLRLLRQSKLVAYEREKLQHIYSLTAAARVWCTQEGLSFRLEADDGSVLSLTIPRESPVKRMYGLP
jgi:DNA-binding transcriptional ArsR family regulator